MIIEVNIENEKIMQKIQACIVAPLSIQAESRTEIYLHDQ